MLSPSSDIQEFIEAVRDKPYLEVLALADREALKAWRLLYRRKGSQEPSNQQGRSYDRMLKGLIRFMRSSVPFRPPGLPEEVFEAFSLLRQDLRPGLLGGKKPLN
jgi:hypothetical protein